MIQIVLTSILTMCFYSQEGPGLLPSPTKVPDKTVENKEKSTGDSGASGMWVSGREGGGLPWEEVARLLQSDTNIGLPSREVLTRRQVVGYNEFKETEDDPLWKKYLGQVSDEFCVFH